LSGVLRDPRYMSTSFVTECGSIGFDKAAFLDWAKGDQKGEHAHFHYIWRNQLGSLCDRYFQKGEAWYSQRGIFMLVNVPYCVSLAKLIPAPESNSAHW
jgi:hypothetical protein